MLPRHWFRRSTPPAAAPPAPAHETRSAAFPRIQINATTNLFDAASTDRLTSGWTTTPSTADSIIRRLQRVLVARSREQSTNNDYVVRYLQMVRQNIVGDAGIQLQSTPRDIGGAIDRLAADAIEAAWKAWGRKGVCEITGLHSWYSLQEVCATTAAMDGEFFVRIIRGSAAANAWGFALQLIDPVRCPIDYDVERPQGGSGNFIRAGIEYTQFGRPVAYFFETVDESEDSYRFGGRTFVRVPASEVLHGYRPFMVGAKRGLPWTSAPLFRLRQLGEYENATLVNARISASKGGFFEHDVDGSGPEPGEDEDIDMEVEPGTFRELPRGVRFKEFNPNFPHGEYAIFHKAQLRGIASGLGVSYNSLSNDLSEVNFSSIRQGVLDERDGWKSAQRWLIESLIEPAFRLWMERALVGELIKVNGKPLPAVRIDKYLDVTWQPRRWQWVDPRADAEANIKAKNNLLQSPSSIIREQGRDPDTVWREVAADIASMKAAGIPEQFIEAAVNDQMGKTYTEGAKNGGQQGQGNA